MKFFLPLFLFCVLLFPENFYSFELLNFKKKALVNPLRREYLDSKFNVKISQSFGVRNLTADFGVSYQFRQVFSIGIANGFHRNKVNLYSTSDNHKLRLWSYPLYVTANIYLAGTTEKAWYIYGRYGKSFGINNKNNDPEKGFPAIMAEGGLGFEKLNENSALFFELGQYYTTSSGRYYSTYDAVIDYNLKIYSFVFRFGVKF